MKECVLMIELTVLTVKGRLKFIINKYKSQTYITVGQKSFPNYVFKRYAKFFFNIYGKNLLSHKSIFFLSMLHK
jgi:hypothetical protein